MQFHSQLEIARTVRLLVRQYGTRDPRKLCDALRVSVVYMDLGRRESSIKALTVMQRRMKCIVVNENLPEVISRFILAHELGHAVLHAKEGAQFADAGLFDSRARTETEAHQFAAELLLGDSEALMAEMRGRTGLNMYQFAASQGVPYELLAYKFGIMKAEGFSVPTLPETPKSGFLRGSLGMNAEYDCP